MSQQEQRTPDVHYGTIHSDLSMKSAADRLEAHLSDGKSAATPAS